MKKLKLYFWGQIALYCLISLSINAQDTLLNRHLEDWKNLGTRFETPNHWTSNQTSTGGFTYNQTCFRANSTLNPGGYCMRITNTAASGMGIQGVATTGRVHVASGQPNHQYCKTVRAHSGTSMPFTSRPDSLVAWVRYNGSDDGSIIAVLHDDYDYKRLTSDAGHIIGEAVCRIQGSSSSWIRLAVPFNYNSPNTPSYLLLIAQSADAYYNVSPHSTLWVDNLEFIYNPTCPTTRDSITVTRCNDPYTGPSGQYTWANTGVYQDTIPNYNGCDSIVEIDLTYSTVDTSVTINGILMTSNAVVGSYQWYDCDNQQAIPGAIYRSFNAPSNGSYALIRSHNGCTDTSACFYINVLGLEESNKDQVVQVYPNPTTGILTLNWKETQAEMQISIINPIGQVVKEHLIQAQVQTQLNLKQLASGWYFIRLQPRGQAPRTVRVRKE